MLLEKKMLASWTGSSCSLGHWASLFRPLKALTLRTDNIQLQVSEQCPLIDECFDRQVGRAAKNRGYNGRDRVLVSGIVSLPTPGIISNSQVYRNGKGLWD